MIKIFMWLLIGALAACSNASAPRLPQALEQVQAADKEARRAVKNGDWLRAQQSFAKTLLLQQSVDDATGVAITIINLATVTHRLHDDESAMGWLDKILLEKSAIYPPEQILEASFRKAVILTNFARLPEAEASLVQAEKLCDKKCSLRFSIEGLNARLRLLKGDALGAIALTQALSQEAGAGKEEHANALRIMAEAEENLFRYTDAYRHFQAALDMDKLLSLSSRISEDLSGLARVAKKLGLEQDAGLYLHRAELVNEALGQHTAP